MTRRRPLCLEAVEDRCLPSGGRFRDGPPARPHDFGEMVHVGADHRRDDADGRRDDDRSGRRDGAGRREVRSPVWADPTPVVEATPAHPVAKASAATATDPHPAAPARMIEEATASPADLASNRVEPTEAAEDVPLTVVPVAEVRSAEPTAAARSQPVRGEAAAPARTVEAATPAGAVAPPTAPVAGRPSSVEIASPAGPPRTAPPGTDARPPATDPGPPFAVVAGVGTPADPPAAAVPTPDDWVPPGVAVDPPAVVVAAARQVLEMVAPLVPLAAALPADLRAVEQAAADLLGGLAEAVEPAGSTAARWGWVGAAVAVAGGFLHAVRPAADRRRPDPLAFASESALARWESRRARRPA